MTQLHVVEAKIQTLLPRPVELAEALRQLRATVVVTLWRHRELRPILRKSKVLAYGAGCASENVFLHLCELDGVEGDEAVRKARKSLVLQLKSMITDLDSIRAGAIKVQRFVTARMTEKGEAEVEDQKDKKEQGSSTEEHVINSEENALNEQLSVESHSSETTRESATATNSNPLEPIAEEDETTEGAEHASSTADLREKRSAPLRRWHPRVRERRMHGGVVVLLSLPDVNEDSLDLQLNGRTIIVSGARNEDPDTMFKESYAIPAHFDLSKATCDFSKNELSITLPYVKRNRTTAFRCAPSPFQHSWFNQGRMFPFY